MLSEAVVHDSIEPRILNVHEYKVQPVLSVLS